MSSSSETFYKKTCRCGRSIGSCPSLLAITMCQLYHWTCNVCLSIQQCICRCPRSRFHGDCSNSGSLPLPQTTPSLQCQRCGNWRGPLGVGYSVPDPRVFSLPAAPKDSQPVEVSLPDKDDIFWQRPSERLPNNADILKRYDDRRKALLAMAGKQSENGGSEERQVDTSSGTGVINSAWEQLKTDLKEG